jgi:BlaI family penicillinase repressor
MEKAMTGKKLNQLSRRERQIMDVIYSRGTATAAEVQQAMPDPPGYSAVRALLKVLEEKGVVQHRQDGPRYIYTATVKRDQVKSSALKHLMQTFFDNSAEKVVSALIDVSGAQLGDDEYRRLSALIEAARRKGGHK